MTTLEQHLSEVGIRVTGDNAGADPLGHFRPISCRCVRSAWVRGMSENARVAISPREMCAPTDLAPHLHALPSEVLQLPYSAARPQASRRKSNEQVLEP
jgi:hypothetical protein